MFQLQKEKQIWRTLTNTYKQFNKYGSLKYFCAGNCLAFKETKTIVVLKTVF